MHELASRLNSIKGLERVPTLLINARVTSKSDCAIFLGVSWKVAELYAAVHELLGRSA